MADTAVQYGAAGKNQERPRRLAHSDKDKDWIIILEEGGIVQVASPAQVAAMADRPPGKETSR